MALPIRQTKQKPIRQANPETEVIDRARPNGILGSMLYNNAILPKPSEERPLDANSLEQITESNPEAVQEALPNSPIAEEARQITNDSDTRNDEVSNDAVESTIEQFNSPYDDISDEAVNNLDEMTANDPDVNAGGKFDINAIANQDAQLMSQIFNIPIPQEEAKPTEETVDEISEETSEEPSNEEDNNKSTLADMLSAINVGGAVSGGSISKAPVSSVSTAVPTSVSTNSKSSAISGSSIGGNNIAKSIESPSVSASANNSSTKPYSPIVNKSYNKAGTINSPKLQNKAISAESAGHNELKASVTNGTFGSGSRTKSKTLSVRNNDIPQEEEAHTASYSNNNIANTDIQNAMISNNIREHIIRASRTWILDDYGFRNSGSKLGPITIRVKGPEIIVNGNGIRNKPFDSLNNNELKLLSSYI